MTNPAKLPKIAFLGLGHMGAPMARRLIAGGYPVMLWSRSPAKRAAVAEAGGTACANAQVAVQDADVVCLCLTDAKAIKAVMFGAEGIAGALKPGAAIVDFATSSPQAAKSLAELLADHEWLDCPVSGGVAGAQAGTLAMLAGGSAKLVERLEPILMTMAARVTRMGDVGAGQAAKLCNQLIVAANLVALSEAVTLGRALGVDVGLLPEALAGGFADSRPLQLFGGRMAAAADLGPMVGSLSTMAKDTRAIRAAARDSKAPGLALTELVGALYDRLVGAGHGDKDLPALMRLYD